MSTSPTSVVIPHTLRNLRTLDIENLMCGRITRQTIAEVERRWNKHDGYFEFDLFFAEELNEMLKAAKVVRKVNGGSVLL
jgi:hypothetical protein